MKKIFCYFMIGLAVVNISSCHEKKEKNIIITHKPVVKAPARTQKMSNYAQSRKVQWLGQEYTVQYERQADTKLGIVRVDDHTKYYDNRVTVRVLRSDGTEFFHRSFVKSDFSPYIDDDMATRSALLGVIFVEAKGDVLRFAASVGSPDANSDEYVPLIVQVSRMGNVSINKDTQMDTNNMTEAPSDDEDEASE